MNIAIIPIARRTACSLILLLLTTSLSPAQSVYEPYTFTTLAGCARLDFRNGTGSAARFANPSSVVADSAGNIYAADTDNHVIRKITPTGIVSTLAGEAGVAGGSDGSPKTARFSYPHGVALDAAGNLYVADRGNHTIRKVTPSGVVTTLAGLARSEGSSNGQGFSARFNSPTGMAFDGAGNIYVADCNNHTIRKVTPIGMTTTFAGMAGSSGSADGTGNTARFNHPEGVAVDREGNIYIADTGNCTIRKATPTGVVTTLAGLAGQSGSTDGSGIDARFGSPTDASLGPTGVVIDSTGNVYVADSGNCTIRKITPVGMVTTFAGTAGAPGSADGIGNAAQFNYPKGMGVDSAGNIYVAENWNSTIRKITPAGHVATLAGRAGGPGHTDGPGTTARLNYPASVTVDRADNIYVADKGSFTIRKITSAGMVTTLAGQPGVSGSADGPGDSAQFGAPTGIAVDSEGNVYIADAGNCTIRKVMQTGVVTTVAGKPGIPGYVDGTGSSARFGAVREFWSDRLVGLAVDDAGNLYVADSGNDAIRKVTPAGVVTTLAGVESGFYNPQGLAVDNSGNVYVANSCGSTILKLAPTGGVTHLAGVPARHCYGSGSADGPMLDACFSNPTAVAVDSTGNIFVTDAYNFTIRKISTAGMVTTLAGLAGSIGSANGTGSAARFYYALGVAMDSMGNVYVADSQNHVIRKGIPASSVLAPVLHSPKQIENQIGFEIAGLPGLAIEIESSDDLSQWQSIGIYVLEDGSSHFQKPDPFLGIEFYRARMH